MDSRLLGAVERNDLSTVKHLLEAGADIDSGDRGGSTPLMRAALFDYIELVGILIDAGADVNLKDRRGFTAFHYAAQEKCEQVAQKLIDAGADVNSQDVNGNSPLSSAVFYSRGEGQLIRVLRRSGADDNLSNKHGVSPLQLAKTIANYDVAQFFNEDK